MTKIKDMYAGKDFPKVKITVVKKLNWKELFGQELPAAVHEDLIPPECTEFEVGQEFLIGNSQMIECPPGFCAWAYADIHREIMHILHGGYYPWMKDEGVILTCCTDGFRPVIFKIERIEE